MRTRRDFLKETMAWVTMLWSPTQSWGPVQYIDVRDMAEWVVRMVEKRTTGIYNAVGPASPLNFRELVETARNEFSPTSRVTWTSSAWLNAREDADLWGTLQFWEQGVGHIMR